MIARFEHRAFATTIDITFAMRKFTRLTTKYAISRLLGMNRTKQFFGCTFHRDLRCAQINLTFFLSAQLRNNKSDKLYRRLIKISLKKCLSHHVSILVFYRNVCVLLLLCTQNYLNTLSYNRRVNLTKYYIIHNACKLNSFHRMFQVIFVLL